MVVNMLFGCDVWVDGYEICVVIMSMDWLIIIMV